MGSGHRAAAQERVIPLSAILLGWVETAGFSIPLLWPRAMRSTRILRSNSERAAESTNTTAAAQEAAAGARPTAMGSRGGARPETTTTRAREHESTRAQEHENTGTRKQADRALEHQCALHPPFMRPAVGDVLSQPQWVRWEIASHLSPALPPSHPVNRPACRALPTHAHADSFHRRTMAPGKGPQLAETEARSFERLSQRRENSSLPRTGMLYGDLHEYLYHHAARVVAVPRRPRTLCLHQRRRHATAPQLSHSRYLFIPTPIRQQPPEAPVLR